MNLKFLLVFSLFFNFNLYSKVDKKTQTSEKVEETKKEVEVKSPEVNATETIKTDKVQEEALPSTETIKDASSIGTQTITEKEAPLVEETQNIPISEDEIISLLKEKHKGTIVGKFIKRYPRLIKLTVRVTTDKEIQKLWADTLKDKTRYYLFIAIFLLTMAISWAWRRQQRNANLPFFQSLKGWFIRVFLINFSRLALFILLFEFELRPIWVLARKTFGF